MRRPLVIGMLVFALCHPGISQTGPLSARIKIDRDRIIGEIDPNIYGNFTEHLGRCIYGGLYDKGSPLADKNGFRLDVLEAAKALNVTLLRYPGGNFVSGYHWEDGIGPEDKRPPRWDLAWKVLEPNIFGTDEFVDFCRTLGTEPYFSVNLGTGTLDEARNWVEYCNVKDGPYYAELRKKNGYPEPHNVKYWSLGNEMDGAWQMGHKNAEDYGKFALEAAKLMKWTSPEIKLVAAGSSDYSPSASPYKWNRTVLEYLNEYIDYIAVHSYLGNYDNDYYKFMASPRRLEDMTQILRGQIQAVLKKNRRTRPIYVAWDEYNVWYREPFGTDKAAGRNALEEKYNLEDALVIASVLNVFLRNADIIKMANLAQLVNVVAPIFTSEKGMFKQTIYYPLALFANNSFGTALDVFVESPEYETNRYKNVPYLDVSSAYEDGEVVINVVNRHLTESISAEIICQEGLFSGLFSVHEINGPDVKIENTFGSEPVKNVEKGRVNVEGARFTYVFPPHSFTMIKGKIK